MGVDDRALDVGRVGEELECAGWQVVLLAEGRDLRLVEVLEDTLRDDILGDLREPMLEGDLESLGLERAVLLGGRAL